MQRLFVFSEMAVVVRAWHEVDPTNAGGDEAGVRVEIRLLGDVGRRGTPSAAQAVLVDQPVWRADLFDLIEGQPGNFARAHFHPRFDGFEPSERCWDDALSSDPMAWLAVQLADLATRLEKGGVRLEGEARQRVDADGDDLAQAVPEIVATAEAILAEVRRPSVPIAGSA
jgi:hypothetical protein